MKKNILWFIALFLLIVSCIQKVKTNLEERQKTLDDINVDASIIFDEIQTKSGNDYISLRDEYYEVKRKWVKTAIQYTKSFSFENKTEDEIRRMFYIADIAKNEQLAVDILKEDFNRFPESKTIKTLSLSYFNYAYLLEPSEVEKYVDFSMFSPGDELYCYAMLALGFSELDNIPQAKKYFEKMNNLFTIMIEDPGLKKDLPLLYIVELRSFIAHRIGDREKAFNIIAEAENEFFNEHDKNMLVLYRNRLNLLGSKAKDLESLHLIGTNKSLSFPALKGKVILLNFFTWDCETCTVDIPFLERLQEEINNDDFMIIGATKYVGKYEHEGNVSEQTEYEYMKNHYYHKRKINWPISMSRVSMHDYGVYSIPAYVLIDKTGIVRDGYVISNFSYLKNKIELLLKENN